MVSADPFCGDTPQRPESESADGVFRDGLKAGREAPGARRGDPRCPDTTARARSGSDRTSLYDEITTKIIAELEAGRVPWVQPWGTAAAKAPLAMPKNAATGRNLFGDQRADPLGVGDRARLSGPGLAHLPPGAVARRQCPQGRARHHRRLCRPLRARRREEAGTGDRRGSAGDPVPEALHRLQPGAVRRAAREISLSPRRRRSPA